MAMVSVSIDDAVNDIVESVCADMGITMSDAINMFITKVACEGRIPYEVIADPFYSEDNIRELERRISDIQSGLNVHEHELIEEA